MAPLFATVSKDEILAVTEGAAPTNQYRERDKISLVGDYWWLEKKFLNEVGTKS